MNTMFEDRLLNELKGEVALRAAEDGPVPSTARRVVTPGRVGIALATCGVAAAAVVAMPGAGTTPAYAVEKNSDGTVTLKLDDIVLSGPEQQDLVRKLEEAGVNTQVNQVPSKMRCAVPEAQLLAQIVGIDPAAVDEPAGPPTEKAKKWKKTLKQGDTLRIDNYAAEGASPAGFAYSLFKGKISPCKLEPNT
ncbi:hypothetical protein [Streptomyces cavernae]|uniref:hypothetical protein n=1 Tax=Streptomyces cavernae TaxID=2259034 RepID=UPI000FEBF214|nr:hypothetical protein [Streptomyces cavernae]